MVVKEELKERLGEVQAGTQGSVASTRKELQMVLLTLTGDLVPIVVRCLQLSHS